jgi:5'-AMP-activated protein kinase catalytic alpha subunit
MQELYRALQYCGVSWKKGGPYNVKCRAIVALRDPGTINSGTLSRGNSGVSANVVAEGVAAAVAAAMMMDDAPMNSPRGESGGIRAPGEIEIKFECQLYKVRDGEYALDIQRIGGDLMQFMCITSDVASVLRI